MPQRRIRFTPANEVAAGFDAIRREAGVALGFEAAAEAEAATAAA